MGGLWGGVGREREDVNVDVSCADTFVSGGMGGVGVGDLRVRDGGGDDVSDGIDSSSDSCNIPVWLERVTQPDSDGEVWLEGETRPDGDGDVWLEGETRPDGDRDVWLEGGIRPDGDGEVRLEDGRGTCLEDRREARLEDGWKAHLEEDVSGSGDGDG